MKLLHNRFKFLASSEGNLSVAEQALIYLVALAVGSFILYNFLH